MAIKEILRHPHDTLRLRAEEVTIFGSDLKQLIHDLADTMYASNGVGLAAPQIGVSKRVFIVEVEGNLGVYINPRILYASGSARTIEGCLSFPGVFEPLTRPDTVIVAYQDEFGKPVETAAKGLLATAVQHELDHLDGTLFIDRMGTLQRKTALKTQRRSN